jgi:hypothetical protein
MEVFSNKFLLISLEYYTWFNIPRNLGRFVNNNLEIISVDNKTNVIERL